MYRRTLNEDGSYTTRCLYCFAALSLISSEEAELDKAEANHYCPAKALAERHARKAQFEKAQLESTSQKPTDTESTPQA